MQLAADITRFVQLKKRMYIIATPPRAPTNKSSLCARVRAIPANGIIGWRCKVMCCLLHVTPIFETGTSLSCDLWLRPSVIFH